MKNTLAAAVGLTVSASAAFAGGVDRSGQPLAALFEAGNYFELSFGAVNPSVSGTQVLVAPPSITGSSSGNMSKDYGFAAMALKMDVSDKFAVALIYDQPFGADVAYPTGTGYFAGGSTAELNTDALTFIGKYNVTDNFSAYAGLRYQKLDAMAGIPFIPGGYSAAASEDDGLGYLVGVAYERPDIALRVSLTYNSAIEHKLATTETSGALGAGRTSTTTMETPQSVNLDFQTGIAPGTLVFGGVRWVDWSEFVLAPADYSAITGGPLLRYADDTFTYTLGIGRQLNENWAVAVSATHEPSTGGLRTNLSPTDGRTALGLGVTYRNEGFKVQAGVQHIWIGDAMTAVGPAVGGNFTDNTAVGFGLKFGYSF